FNEVMRTLSIRQLTTRAIVLGILVLTLIATYFFSWNVADQVSRPIQVLAEVASRLGAGELDARTKMQRRDELGVVADRLDQMAEQLQNLLGGLEAQVAERTQALERRAAQIQTASEVGRAVAEVRDLDRLLDRVVHLISERFGFYHAGIFLMDEEGRWAELRAASSPGGQRMLARGHRLAVGDTSIVGWVAQHRQPRIALDVGEDAVWFDNPDLPQTRSEMALPLVVGGELLGVLDVQSTEAGAFSQEDIEVLRLLADQVAVSIVNARLFARMQEALQEVETLNRQLTGQAWMEFLHAASLPPGYRYRAARLEPLRDEAGEPILDQAAVRKRVVMAQRNGQAEVALPLVLRGQVIGSLGFRRQDGQAWNPQTLEVAQAIVEEMVRALESARLFEEAQARAAREQVTGQIVARIRETLDLEMMLKTAAQEVRRALGLPEVVIRLTGQLARPSGNGAEPGNRPSASGEEVE
ncbi:MAG: GAF domain-containing protein, partial [Chloroflexi bacterium]